MNKLIKLAVVMLTSATAFAAWSANVSLNEAQESVKPSSPQEAEVRKLIEPEVKAAFGDGAKVDSVIKTPYGGLYEVRMNGGDVFYTDDEAKYMFMGSIRDAKDPNHNYTKERIDEFNIIKFGDLPFSYAAKMVKGNGKRKIAVFEDPNCGYCKRFRHTLQDMDNITVYTFMYNILAPDSKDKSTRIWCSPDRAKAWDEWMVSGKLPGEPSASCKAPNDEVLAIGQKLRITGTPTIFFTDGSRIPGAVDKQGLEEKLSSIK